MVTKDLIRTKLKEVEDKKQVRILYAVESGSRGWGFESKDSDYDVRFIYTHPLEWYISIEDKSDVIEYPVSEIYIEQGVFAQSLRELMPKFYSPISSLHHYLHMAQGNYKAYLGQAIQENCISLN